MRRADHVPSPDSLATADRAGSAPWVRHPVGGALPEAETRSWLAARFSSRPLTVATALLLYVGAASLLLGTMGHAPDYLFNWEEYPAADIFDQTREGTPVSETFRITDGLMTDSGWSPLVAGPVRAGMDLLGVGLAGFRTPMVLLSVGAVPLTWLLGRLLVGPGAGLLAAVFVALSPAMLVYGRTATVVGASVTLALLTALVLLITVRDSPRRWPARLPVLVGLQLCLVAGAWGYSPVRLLWPLALAVILVELVARRSARGWLLAALGVTLTTLPLFVTVMRGIGMTRYESTWDLPEAMRVYFNAGGEQLVRLAASPSGFGSFLPPEDATGSALDQSIALVQRNLLALGRLLTDQDTRPALSDYWNPHGQLYSAVLVPAAVFGAIILLTRIRRSTEARFTAIAFLGLALPMVATTQVHIGRLVFASPFLLIIAALGVTTFIAMLVVHLPNLIARVAAGDRSGANPTVAGFRGLIQVVLATALVVAVAGRAWVADTSPPIPSGGHTPQVAEAIRELRDQGVPAIALVSKPPDQTVFERLDVAGYRIAIDDVARFRDLGIPPAAAGLVDPAPVPGRIDVYWGELAAPEDDRVSRLPGAGCDVTWLIPEGLMDDARPVLDDLAGRCDVAPPVVTLPY